MTFANGKLMTTLALFHRVDAGRLTVVARCSTGIGPLVEYNTRTASSPAKTRCGQLDKMAIDESGGHQEGSDASAGTSLHGDGHASVSPCGEEFVVFHDPTVADKKAAARQAQRLEKVLAEEHERERRHSDRIQLPD